MSIQLSQTDYDRLLTLLVTMPEWRAVADRVTVLDDVLAGSPRRQDVLPLLNLDGPPRAAGVRTLTRLTQFGQDEPGRETLGVLINKLLTTYVGGGDEADFLRGLFTRYPLAVTPAAARGLTDWRGTDQPGSVQEKVIGENTLRDVRLLELALAAARAVVRIDTGAQLGTGFVAGQGLVMTNQHVIGTAAAGRGSRFDFNYQLDRDGQPAPVVAVGAVPDGLFYTNNELDFTLLEVEVPAGVAPLQLAARRALRDQRVNIIQHPGGHFKKISMQNNFVAYADGRDIQYLTTTEPGSSGSPVFDDDFVVIGIHHSGGLLLEPGTNRRYLRNAGSSLIAILADVQANAPALYTRLNLGR